MLFDRVKDALPVSGNSYDGHIITQIRAAVLDMTKTAEIVIDGVVDIERDADTGVITDNSSIEDELIITAITVWCNMHIGNPPNYEQLLRSYNSLKGSLRISGDYTDYGGGGGTCDC